MSLAPVRQALEGGREHWQHGPIDLVIEARGEAAALARAYTGAWARFQNVLAELVFELPLLRLAVEEAGAVRGSVARRMVDAALPYAPRFITPMAAVAGSVAEEILGFFAAEAGVTRAFVNNGGDIALHLGGGESFTAGLVADAYAPVLNGQLRIEAESGIRGIATSGWRGRSFSLGIADCVTVLARGAAAADAAATMIANAVDADHPAIARAPANRLKDDTDLGARLVTVSVGTVPASLRRAALDAGARAANEFMRRGLIIGAALALQGEWRSVGEVQATLQANAQQRLAA
ncbi:MAG: ApbE family lipoprotein [Betaproteobacteria bacterium]|nr:ApbE family lipoprotein [Betaproteobacteria bacterium]